MSVQEPSLAGRHCFVTGATGFLGSAFVRRAVRDGAQVTVIGRSTSSHWRLAEVQGRYGSMTVPLHELARTDVAAPRDALFVHFAAAGVNQTVDDVDDMVATNVGGTLAALTFARRVGVERFVLAGTSGEYGAGVALDEDAPLRPSSEYGATRAAATMLARAFGARRGLDVVVVRPFAVFGPYEARYRLVPHAILGALGGVPVRISSGHQTRDYVHVDDVTSGIAAACVVPGARGGMFNLCTGVETSVRDAAALAVRLVGSTAGLEIGAVPPVPGEMWRTSGDPARAREVLGWAPSAGLEAGLRRTIDWFRAEGLRLPEYEASA